MAKVTATACVLLLAVGVLSGSFDARLADGANGALAIVVNRGNPIDDLTVVELRRIFMFDTQMWPNGRKITILLRETGQPEREEAIRLVCRLSGAEYDRHVLLQTFRGSIGWGPRSIRSATAMQRFVFNVPGAIGYVRADEVDGTAKVLRVGGLRPSDPRYPLRHGPRAD
jgi:ABC-type phosphate transport system substrate-binding protein